MAQTTLSDVIIPDVYETYTAVNSPETSAFLTSGVAVHNPFLDTVFDNGGSIFYVPFWKDLDQTVEPNYSSDDVTAIASPQKVTAGEMQGRSAWLNQAYSSADLVTELAGSEPMQRVRDRFGIYWQRQWERRILAACVGIMADNVANEGADMVIDVSVTAKANVTSANLWGTAVFSSAIFTLGDQFGGIKAIACHSLVAKRMFDLNLLMMVPSNPLAPISDVNPEVPVYMGRRVIIDDLMPVTAVNDTFKYVTMLFGDGFIGFGEGTPKTPTEVWRNPQGGNGGGLEQLWERKTWALHPYGYKWTNATVTGQSPNLANLKLAANWSRQIDRKLIPMAYVVTNG